jgi:hypothetical protein
VELAFHTIDGARAHIIERTKRVAGGAPGHTTVAEMDVFSVVDEQGEVIERVYLERVVIDRCLFDRLGL